MWGGLGRRKPDKGAVFGPARASVPTDCCRCDTNPTPLDVISESVRTPGRGLGPVGRTDLVRRLLRRGRRRKGQRDRMALDLLEAIKPDRVATRLAERQEREVARDLLDPQVIESIRRSRLEMQNGDLRLWRDVYPPTR